MPIFDGVYKITNQQSKTCVDLDGGNSADGTKVQGWAPLSPDAPEYPNQLWKIKYTNKPGVDSYTISNFHTGTYLEISGGNATDGTQVTCSAAEAGQDTKSDQEWEFVKINGFYKVRNVASQNYMDIDSGSSANATKIQGWWGELDGNPNQLWGFEEVTPPN
ncbi:ricin B lectin domain-containing protein [Mycena capillaripes]|nr:ricin B lectin domain-containing protein [Mycena capillaripes]